jgi:hypothetical protein
MRTVPRLCDEYPGICLTTEEIVRKNLSQGSRRVPVGTMKTEYTEQIYIYIYMCVCVCVCVCLCMHVSKYVCLCMYVYVYY